MPMTDEQLRCLTEEERSDYYAAENAYRCGSRGHNEQVMSLLRKVSAERAESSTLRQRVAGLEKALQEVADDDDPVDGCAHSNDAKNALAARPTGNAEREGDWRYRLGTVKDLLQGQVRAGVNMEELSRQIVTALAARPTGGEG